MIMLSYILNDFKKAIRSKGTLIYLIGTAGVILIANIAVICFRFIYGNNEGTFAYNVFEYASWCFLIPYYSCILIAQIVIGKKYPAPEDSPLPPWQTYIAKLVTSLMLASVFLIAAFVLLYAVTSAFHADEGIIKWYIVKIFLGKACLSLPLWFAGISFAVMFLLGFEKRWKAYAGFVILAVVIPQLIRFFSLDTFKNGFFRLIRRYTITQSFGLVPYPSYPERSVPLIVAIGLIYGFLALIAGIVIYQKKAS